ncbi:hypothetical protein Ciccas_010162 [Cichlidogyrus casuarinus]|uniref:Uncharacterized protein n=1 Tax=Cichlidogyrus casuarinus TaxID=1844966 RepID=A0ABD2PUX4_9PLAT
MTYSLTTSSTIDFSSYTDQTDPYSFNEYNRYPNQQQGHYHQLSLFSACFFCPFGQSKENSPNKNPRKSRSHNIFKACFRGRNQSPPVSSMPLALNTPEKFNPDKNASQKIQHSGSVQSMDNVRREQEANANEVKRSNMERSETINGFSNNLGAGAGIAVCVDTEKTPSPAASGLEFTAEAISSSKIEMTPAPVAIDEDKTKGRAGLHQGKISTCIKTGHVTCVKSFITRINSTLAGDQYFSPSAHGLEELSDLSGAESPDDNDCEYDDSPPANPDEYVISVRRQFIRVNKINSNGFIGPYQVIEFKQRCSPLVWALDCLQWEILRLFSNSIVKTENKTSHVRQEEKHLCLYPDRPQNVTRKLINKKSIRPRDPSQSPKADVYTPKGSSATASPSRIKSQNNSSSSRGLAALLDPRQLESKKVTKRGSIFTASSWSSLALPLANSGLQVGLSPFAGMILSSASARKMSSGSHQNLLLLGARRSPTSPQKMPSISYRHPGEAIMVVSASQPENKPVLQLNGGTRSFVYRFPWFGGSHTYQSILDYFIASGYEMVGCETIHSGFHNCKRRDSADFYAAECYPAAPDDPRNNLFLAHFSRLPRVIRSTGVKVNRIDSVMAFNAILTSAGHRLTNWVQHGAELDTTVAKSHLNRCLSKEPWWEKPSKTDFDKGPLLEWRIISTLIENGLNEFEWLDFQSPQFNIVGQILTVFLWPVYGWTEMDAKKHFSGDQALESPNLGYALRRQAALLLVNLWSLGAFQPYKSGIKSGEYREDLTTEGGQLKRTMLKGGAHFMNDSDEIVSRFICSPSIE